MPLHDFHRGTHRSGLYRIVAGRRSRQLGDVGRRPCYAGARLGFLLLSALLPAALPAFAEAPTTPPPTEVAARYGQQRVRQILAERLPHLPADAIERIAQGFEEHLLRSSRMFSENYAAGRMEEGELISRVSVYLHDNPGLLGRTLRAVDDVGTRVGKALTAREAAPRTPTERTALAERFIRNLAEHSRLAHQNLLAGRMSDEELASRASVFLEDLRAEATTTAGPDPAQVAAAELVADQFVRQNFGSANERATALVYDCVITTSDTARAQTLRIMRKSPDKIRIHFVADGLVTLAMAYDGSTAWMQRPARAAEPIPTGKAALLTDSAPFDHQLVGYRERGATLTLRGGGAEAFELTLHETDGRLITSTIDPVTYQESRQLLQAANGQVSETRLRDYRRVGSVNVPCTQELWRSGVLLSTTRLENVSTETTLLNSLFTTPDSEMVTYMDYMGGLALLRDRAAPTAATTAPTTAASPTLQ